MQFWIFHYGFLTLDTSFVSADLFDVLNTLNDVIATIVYTYFYFQNLKYTVYNEIFYSISSHKPMYMLVQDVDRSVTRLTPTWRVELSNVVNGRYIRVAFMFLTSGYIVYHRSLYSCLGTHTVLSLSPLEKAYEFLQSN